MDREKLGEIKDILMIIVLLWVIVFFIFLFLDGFKIIEFTPGVAEGSGVSLSDFFKFR